MTRRRLSISALLLSALASTVAGAQTPVRALTRFEIGGHAVLSEPKEEFRQNVGRGWGGGGTVKYNLLRSGLVGFRFDVSGVEYGREKLNLPVSRVILEQTTTNSITTLTWGPELTRPSGRLRPYVNAGYSRLLFRTRSSLGAYDSSGNGASTTNYHDSTGAWAYGGGLRFALVPARFPLDLDFGLRYHRGGNVSYLREGSIQDNPDGPIFITPLSSRTPFIVYSVGAKFRITFDGKRPCARFLC